MQMRSAKALVLLIGSLALIGISAAQVASGSSGQSLVCEEFVQVSDQGFGDRQNSFAWSMQWWNGKLYVGTGRSFFCVVMATVDAELGIKSYPPKSPNVECAPTPQDLDLRAEIWRYTPETEMWERVFRSPDDVPIPGHPGKFVARDIGFRSMAVFTEPDGTEALYVAGVSSRSVNGSVPPPRILRSEDGLDFHPIPQEPGTFLGDLPVMLENRRADRSFRSMAVYKGRLFVIASDFRGDGVLLEAAKPAEGNDNFGQVSPPDMKVFVLQVFNGFLYLGLRTRRGYAVVKTDATGEPPYTFIPLVTNGGFKWWPKSPVALSMHPFQDRLYVGTDRPTELIRINQDDTWELVVGPPRYTPQGWKNPICSPLTGFGNPFNGHFWRMQEHQGCLYLGTWDWSVQLLEVPFLDPFLTYQHGFDLFVTSDGEDWVRVTRDGFGDGFNYGGRTMASTPFGLFIGTANPYFGTQIWQGEFLGSE